MLVKNEREHLEQSLPRLLEQDFSREWDLLMVDSGSTDGSPEFVQEFCEGTLPLRLLRIPPERFHHAGTRNLAIEESGADLVLFLGGDAIPANNRWLSALVEPVLGGEDEVVASYGRQVPRADADLANTCRMRYNYPEESRIKHGKSGDSLKETYHFSSVSCCIDRRNVRAPVFDDRFPVNEDATLAREIIDSGQAIAYVAESIVIHSHNYGRWEIFRRSFDNAMVFTSLGMLEASESVKGDGFRYFRESLDVVRSRSWIGVFEFFPFFMASALGVLVGMRHEMLPDWLTTSISHYGLRSRDLMGVHEWARSSEFKDTNPVQTIDSFR